MSSKFTHLPFLGSSVGRRRNTTTDQDGNGVDGAQEAHPTAKKAVNGNGAANRDLQQSRTAQEVAQMSEEDIIADYNSPIHMWVVSTLFPLVAGTFGPMASMFNICAISTDWRIIVNPNSDEASGATVQDPTWLIAVNVVCTSTEELQPTFRY